MVPRALTLLISCPVIVFKFHLIKVVTLLLSRIGVKICQHKESTNQEADCSIPVMYRYMKCIEGNKN